ncbi:MAG: sel1 repeat family protein [Deltaproteobacteria bacterium]|nr:sel1 repeat family protein [Deltaproteobacteria bacterium]
MNIFKLNFSKLFLFLVSQALICLVFGCGLGSDKSAKTEPAPPAPEASAKANETTSGSAAISPVSLPGRSQFLSGDFKAARPLLYAAGRSGDLRAVYFLRLIAQWGLDGRKPNEEEASRYLSLLTSQKERMEALLKTASDEDKAVYLATLALLHFKGLAGPSSDIEQAASLARQAAKLNFVPAMNLIAAIILSPGLSSFNWRHPFGGNPSEAFGWCLKAAEAGDVLAMANLGYLYHQGLGVNSDVYAAASWTHKAADRPQTTPRCYNDLGFYYQEGRAVTPDQTEAKRWYEKASLRGYQLASQNLKKLRAGAKEPPSNFAGLEY